jgi:hypothetical protein
MANINYQRKGIRISVAVFGPEGAGPVRVLETLRDLCLNPADMMSVREEGGEVLSFFAPLRPRKVDGVEVQAKFVSARDSRGDGRIWNGVLRQADGVVFMMDFSPHAADSNSKAATILNSLFPVRSPDTAVSFLFANSEGDPPSHVIEKANPAGKPACVLNAVPGPELRDSATLITANTLARFQRQYETMGGKGSLGERAKMVFDEEAVARAAVSQQLRKAAEAAPPEAQPVPAAVPEAPEPPEIRPVVPVFAKPSEPPRPPEPLDVSWPAWTPEPVAPPASAHPAGRASDPPEHADRRTKAIEPVIPAVEVPLYSTPAYTETFGELPGLRVPEIKQPAGDAEGNAAPSQPPAKAPAGGGAEMAQTITDQEVRDAAENLLAAAAVVGKVPSLCEAVAHVAVAVRMLSTRVEGMEKAAEEMGRVRFDESQARGLASKLEEARLVVAALTEEKERFGSLLDEEREARESARRSHEAELAGARDERIRLFAEIEEYKKDIEEMRSNAARLETERRRLVIKIEEAEEARVSFDTAREQLAVRLEDETAGRAGDRKKFEAELAAANAEREEFKSLSGAQASRAAGLEGQLADAHKEMEVLKVAVESIERDLVSARNDWGAARSQADHHAMEAREFAQKIAELERELKDSSDAQDRSRAEAAELRSALDVVQSRVNSLHEEMTAEHARAASATDAEQKALAEARLLRNETEMLKAHLARSAAEGAELAALREAASGKDQRIKTLEEDLLRKDAEISSLKGSIAEMAQRAQETASLATLSGVHVPPSQPPMPYPPVGGLKRGPVLPPNIPLPPRRMTARYGAPEQLKQEEGQAGQKKDEEGEKK